MGLYGLKENAADFVVAAHGKVFDRRLRMYKVSSVGAAVGAAVRAGVGAAVGAGVRAAVGAAVGAA
eukprot:150292-Chlamydomonas_euryale.AAC.1